MLAPPPDGRRRLDPRTLVTRLVTLSAVRQYWTAAVPLVAVLGVRGGALGVAGVLAAVAAATVGAAVVEWWRTSYGVADGRLVVERGLLRRAVTVVPTDRIRGVDVHASALQRLLGIASVRVDAAATGGKDDEAVLDAVSAAEAGRLRDLLLRQVPGPAAAAGPAGEVLARFEPRWLLYAPLVGTYLVAPVAAAGALAQVADDVRLPLPVRRWLDDAVGSDPGAGTVLLLVLAAAVLAVAGAMVTAAVANWGFTLTRRGGTLVAERGLVSRRQVSLEHDRIRGYALSEPLPLRAVRAARLTALVTGLGGGDDEGGTGRRGQLLPLGPAAVARRVAAAAVTTFDAPLRRHPPAARRRRLVRAVLPGLAAAVALAVAGWWPAAAAALVLAALGVPLGLDRYAGLGSAVDARSVSVRSGSLRRRQVVLARRGVVGATVRQSFFQRRAGLATVTVATGAGSGGYDAVDLGAGDVAPLLGEIRVAPRSTLGP